MPMQPTCEYCRRCGRRLDFTVADGHDRCPDAYGVRTPGAGDHKILPWALYAAPLGRWRATDGDGQLWDFPAEAGGWSRRIKLQGRYGLRLVAAVNAAWTGWPGCHIEAIEGTDVGPA